MRWLLDNLIVVPLIAFAVLIAAMAVLGAVGNRARTGSEPWPRRWRWLCRTGQHTAVGGYPDQDTCWYEVRCATCDRLRRRFESHQHAPVGTKDSACAQLTVCGRCGDQRRVVTHDTYTVVGEDLTDTQRDRLPSWASARSCDLVEICRDCGDHTVSWREEHDPRNTDFDHRCRRCGHWDSEA